MAICGICKQNESVEHIRSHYAELRDAKAVATALPEVTGFAKSYVDSRDYKPMATVTDVPASRYALKDDSGWIFYQVRYGKAGTKWENFPFVDRLIGQPGDYLERPVKGPSRKAVLNLIAQDPQSAAKAFGHQSGTCAVCNASLSDPESLERGMGPHCAKRFG